MRAQEERAAARQMTKHRVLDQRTMRHRVGRDTPQHVGCLVRSMNATRSLVRRSLQT